MRYCRILFFLCVAVSISLSCFAFYATNEAVENAEDDLFSRPRMQAYEESLGLISEDDSPLAPLLMLKAGDDDFSEITLVSKKQKKLNELRKAREQDERKRNTELKDRFDQKREEVRKKVQHKKEKVLYQKKSMIVQGILLALCLTVIGFIMYREGVFKDFLSK